MGGTASRAFSCTRQGEGCSPEACGFTRHQLRLTAFAYALGSGGQCRDALAATCNRKEFEGEDIFVLPAPTDGVGMFL
jgi:hypothetical protein